MRQNLKMIQTKWSDQTYEKERGQSKKHKNEHDSRY